MHVELYAVFQVGLCWYRNMGRQAARPEKRTRRRLFQGPDKLQIRCSYRTKQSNTADSAIDSSAVGGGMYRKCYLNRKKRRASCYLDGIRVKQIRYNFAH